MPTQAAQKAISKQVRAYMRPRARAAQAELGADISPEPA